MRDNVKSGKFDWILISIYFTLVIFGWMNIYSSVYTEEHNFVFDFSRRYGMQLIWIFSSSIIAFLILFVLNPRIYNVLSPAIFIGVTLLLLAVIFLGKEINGSKSWFVLGPISFQPAEISKISTALFLSYIMSKYNFKLSRSKDAISVACIILIPMLLIILEKETGSALVYLGFIFVLYREGWSGWILVFGLLSILFFVTTLSFTPLVSIIILFIITSVIISIIKGRLLFDAIGIILIATLLSLLPTISNISFMGFMKQIKLEYWAIIILLPIFIRSLLISTKKKLRYVKLSLLGALASLMLIFSVDFIFDNILQAHQRARIENLLGIEEDLKGAGYNVHQSKIAIGSGGFLGKGYLNGTQTKFNFVPEQSTDFIFCTVGEEWGFVGSSIVILLYISLIIRIIYLSERQKDKFTAIYGYCIASCFFMHVFINIGMTLGIVPVIGIPLPFLSYGGSSLWSFTTMLFIFIKLDQRRWA